MKVELEKDEKTEPLGKNMSIIVSPAHLFGTDAILLADFADIHKGDKVCDLGTGCGIIPLLWKKADRASEIYAVDIQKKACSQLERSLKLNGIDNISILNADLRELKGKLEFGKFDVVTMNPPYKPVGTGIESETDADKIARHEIMCDLDDLVSSAKRLLRYGGRLCICHRPERLCDIMVSMRNGGIEPKRVRFVVQSSGKKPWLVLVDGKSGGKPHLTVEGELRIKNDDGTDSEEMIRIFGDYRENGRN